MIAALSRRAFLSGAAALAAAPRAFAAGDIYVHAGANFTPVTIAVTPLAGDVGETKIGAIARQRSRPFDVPAAARSANFPEAIANPDARRISTPGRRSTRSSC